MRISPVIPTVASLLLAALWGLSVFAGWGMEAFCTDDETSVACAERLDGVSTFSGLFAVIAAFLTVGAWLFPARFAVLIAGAVLAWLVAEGVLFVGGMLAR
ncbi:hypothetical protein ACFXJ8_19730 [Nonomuraea sp. NPDC059194]|uniref:hypothetical protein n=1 Tax=Nonomuraea sp. NPDC059194 TaxID=3346764 RepID=UPI0036C463EF